MDANIFEYNDDQYYIEQIIATIKYSYEKLIENKKKSPYLIEEITKFFKINKGEKAKVILEDFLRNDLVINYIDKYKSEFNIEAIRFTLGVEEINKETLLPTGILDIRISIPIPNELNYDNCIIMECKRLSNSSSKKKYYINQGINRFITRQYNTNNSQFDNFGFMLAFLENDAKALYTVNDIITSMNEIITNQQYNTASKLELIENTSHFNNYELDNSKIKNTQTEGFFLLKSNFMKIDQTELELQHILLDYREIIQQDNTGAISKDANLKTV